MMKKKVSGFWQVFLCALVLAIACCLTNKVIAVEQNALSDTTEIESNIALKEVPLDVIAFIKSYWNFITDEHVMEVEKINDNNKIYYEIEFEGDGLAEKISIKASEKGVPVEIEREIDSLTLPFDVKKSVNEVYPDIQIEESDIVFNILYEIEGMVGNQLCEIKVDGSGQVFEKECGKQVED